MKGVVGHAPPPRRAVLTTFRDDDGAVIDQGIVVHFPAPHSYTGEQVLELQGHGGQVVLTRLVRRCVSLGARMAEPGEFTERAFLNGKLDLAQAESVADVIEATTERAARCAVRSLTGEFSAAIDSLVAELDELRALVEATLDFPEEDVDSLQASGACERLTRVHEKLAATLRASRIGSVLREGIQVVLVGRPNVGKSTLLNRLAGEDIAIVTDIPGTTRDPIKQTLQIRGFPLHVIDTAGLRPSEDPIEKIGMERTRAAIDRADVVVVIQESGNEGSEALDAVPAHLPRIDVTSKIDLTGELPGLQWRDGGAKVKLSAFTGEGIDSLEEGLLATMGYIDDEEGLYMARERHLEALASAQIHLSSVSGESDSVELIAEQLRLARNALASITGEFTPDDLLRVIFSRFCIGK